MIDSQNELRTAKQNNDELQGRYDQLTKELATVTAAREAQNERSVFQNKVAKNERELQELVDQQNRFNKENAARIAELGRINADQNVRIEQLTTQLRQATDELEGQHTTDEHERRFPSTILVFATENT